MKCPKCFLDNSAGQGFCSRCGSDLMDESQGRDSYYSGSRGSAQNVLKGPDSAADKRTNPLRCGALAFPLLLLVMLLLGAVIFGMSQLFARDEVIEPDDTSLLSLAKDNADLFTDRYSDIPFASAEFLSVREAEVDGEDYYILTGIFRREDDLAVYEGEFQLYSIWDSKERNWQVQSILPGSKTLYVDPKTVLNSEDVRKNLAYLTVRSDQGNLWQVLADNLENLTIADIEKDESGTSATAKVDFVLASVMRELSATVSLKFNWSYGTWHYERGSLDILAAKEVPKAEAVFNFGEAEVKALWAGQTLQLAPSSGQISAIQVSIPLETPEAVLQNIEIFEITPGSQDGVYDVRYAFDINIGDWFVINWQAEQEFLFDLEGKSYYPNQDKSVFHWESRKINISGEWFGQYSTPDNKTFTIKLNIVQRAENPLHYIGEMTISSPKGDLAPGTYAVTAELNSETLLLNLNYGEWLSESSDFFRFGFTAFVFPDETTIAADSPSAVLMLGRDPELAAVESQNPEQSSTQTLEIPSSETSESDPADAGTDNATEASPSSLD